MERCFFVWQNGGDGENKKGTSISTFRNLRVLFDFSYKILSLHGWDGLLHQSPSRSGQAQAFQCAESLKMVSNQGFW